MTARYLYLFAIGPVQAFIAQARRTQDLYMGSRMLSTLAGAGVRAAMQSAGFQPIFPVPQQGFMFSDGDLRGTPHRFAFLSDAEPHALAASVEKAIRERWHTQFAKRVKDWLLDTVGSGDWVSIFDQQSSNWLEFYWVAVPYDEKKHAESFKKANAALAQRKYARHFPQIEAAGEKCTLTGIQSALPFKEAQRERLTQAIGNIVIRPNERLGALALIKRLAGRYQANCFGEDFEVRSTTAIARDQEHDDERTERLASEAGRGREVEGYLAILHMDGDRMGKRLSELTSLKDHQEFSRKLSRFAQKVPEIVRTYGGRGGLLVYSGGDDVLALLPLRHVLACAHALYQEFKQITGLTASAGIAITPHDLPLESALELARKAEETAKDDYGRDALVFTEAHGTGQMRSAGANWGVVPFLEGLQALFQSRKISSKLGYELQAIDHDLQAADMAELRRAEILRVAKRRTAEGANFERDVKPMMDHMIELVERRVIPTWSDMANWAILARFLATDFEEKEKRA